MAINNSPPDLLLKIIWMVHFVLSTWALLSAYLPMPYLYCHFGVLAFGFWAIVSRESVDAVLMTFLTMAFSVINDIIVIAIYEPRTHDLFDRSASGLRDEHRFAVAMSIINILIKPLSLFLLYRILQSRSTGEEVFTSNVSGMFSGFNTSGSNRQNDGSYSNIESASHPPQSHPGIYGQNPTQQRYSDGSSGYQTPSEFQNPPPSAPSRNEKAAMAD